MQKKSVKHNTFWCENKMQLDVKLGMKILLLFFFSLKGEKMENEHEYYDFEMECKKLMGEWDRSENSQ